MLTNPINELSSLILRKFQQLLLEVRTGVHGMTMAQMRGITSRSFDLASQCIRQTPLVFGAKSGNSLRMTMTFRLGSDELNSTFIERVKVFFPHQPVVIEVTAMDETDYLLSDPLRRDRLLRSIRNIEEGRNLVVPDQSMFQ